MQLHMTTIFTAEDFFEIIKWLKEYFPSKMVGDLLKQAEDKPTADILYI